jgi:prepilin-type processing-associated H-X9-DG protein
MKKVFSLLLAGGLVFGVLAIASAQPPTQVTGAAETHSTTSPKSTIVSFLFLCSNDQAAVAASMVEGTNPKAPSLKIFDETDEFDFGHLQLRATQFKMKIDPKNPNSGIETYNLTFFDPTTGFGLTQKDQVTMNRLSLSDGSQKWVIVPEHLKTLNLSQSARMTAGNLADGYCGYTNYLATMIAYPQEVLPEIYLGQSMDRLNQLGLALNMFGIDHDGRMDFNQQNLKEKLSPYLKDTSNFVVPGDSPEPVTFAVNPNIVGVNLANISSPSQTVAFYLGHDQKLDFRYDGLSPVCFADGHVKAVSREDAKDLRWKP